MPQLRLVHDDFCLHADDLLRLHLATSISIRHQTIAAASNRLDQAIARGARQGSTQLAHVHVDRPLTNEDVLTPNAIKQLRTGMYAVRVHHQEVQQAEFQRTERDCSYPCLGLHCHAKRKWIKLQPTDLRDFVDRWLWHATT